MSRIKNKYIRWGIATTDDVNSRVMPANFTPSNYTPTQVGTEGSDKVSSHLKGIDNALGSIVPSTGDIPQTSWAGPVDNTNSQVITGLLFANTVRSIEILMNIQVDNGTTNGLNATYKIYITRMKTNSLTNGVTFISWEYTGDQLTNYRFLFSSDGQVAISTGAISGFVSAQTRFRAITLSD